MVPSTIPPPHLLPPKGKGQQSISISNLTQFERISNFFQSLCMSTAFPQWALCSPGARKKEWLWLRMPWHWWRLHSKAQRWSTALEYNLGQPPDVLNYKEKESYEVAMSHFVEQEQWTLYIESMENPKSSSSRLSQNPSTRRQLAQLSVLLLFTHSHR